MPARLTSIVAHRIANFQCGGAIQRAAALNLRERAIRVVSFGVDETPSSSSASIPMRVGLPMYDPPELRREVDAWWSGLADSFRRAGIPDVPCRLDRDIAFDALWSAPDLLFAQACGFPMVGHMGGPAPISGDTAIRRARLRRARTTAAGSSFRRTRRRARSWTFAARVLDQRPHLPFRLQRVAGARRAACARWHVLRLGHRERESFRQPAADPARRGRRRCRSTASPTHCCPGADRMFLQRCESSVAPSMRRDCPT